MKIITQVINGKEVNYKVMNGTAYHVETPDEVVKVLDRYLGSNVRIRVFYGDVNTGKDWCEEYNTMGTIGRSSGQIKVPLLIKNRNARGGSSLLDDCIVRITVDKKDVYRHSNYHQGEFTKKANPYQDKPEYLEAVFINGNNHAAFKKQGQADRWIKFMKGESNRK